MILIPVDEADAFDRQSIAYLKKDGAHLGDLLSCYIGRAIGDNNWADIVKSSEYAALDKANRDTFEMVERAKVNHCSAQDVDRANYQRYLAKKALQEKFFPKSHLTETKTDRPY